MRAEINARVTDRRRDEKIEPAPTFEKECEDNGDRDVVRHVAGGKRRAGAVAIFIGGITHERSLEEGEEFRAGLLQFDHADPLHLFRPAAIDHRFEQTNGEISIYKKRDR